MSPAIRGFAIIITGITISAFVLVSAPISTEAQTNACVNLTRLLQLGSSDATTNGEVSKLQQFLTETGDYTYGSITGYFGPATEAALKKYQCAKGIACSGTPRETGYGVVGPRTRAAMRCQVGGSGGVTLTASPTSVASGGTVTLRWASGTQFDTCSLTANGTSIAQNQPTTSTFTHNPTVNTTYQISCRPFAQGAPATATAYVTVTPNNEAVQCAPLSRTLYLGHTDADTNGEVSKLQRMLTKIGRYTGAVNGTFDAATETAVKAFQCAEGISCTGSPDTTGYGMVGPRTRSLLFSRCVNGGNTPPPLGPSDAAKINGPDNVVVNQVNTWTLTPSGDTTATYKMDWGDNSASEYANTTTYWHSYSSIGVFPVTATTKFGNGTSKEDVKIVYVRTQPELPPGDFNLTLSATPSSVTPGQSVTLSWSSTNSAFQRLVCTLYANNSQIATSLEVPGTRTHTPTVSTTYRMDCRSLVDSKAASAYTYVGVGPVTGSIVCPQDAKQCPNGSYVGRVAPSCEFAGCPGGSGGGTITLTASPSSITAGQSVTLSWVVPRFTAGTASCKLYANEVQIGGTFTTQTSYTHSPSGSTNYKIVCGEGLLISYTGTRYVTVTPTVGNLPTIQLTATPSSVASGQMVTLSWARSNVSNWTANWSIGLCSITANGTTIASSKEMPGTMTHTPTSFTTYGIQCTGSGPFGSTAFTASATVGVTGGVDPYTSFNFTALPSSVTAGQTVTLRVSKDTTKNDVHIPSCSFTANGVPLSTLTIDAGGNIVTTTHAPQVTTTYVASCQMNSGGYATETRTVTVGGAMTRLEATPTQGQAPLLVNLKAINVGTSGKYYLQYGNGQEALICNQDVSGVGRCGTDWSGSHTYSSAGTYNAVLLFAPTCAAGTNCSTVLQTVGTATVTVSPVAGTYPPTPQLKLTVSPSSITAAYPVLVESVTLSWNATQSGMTSCKLWAGGGTDTMLVANNLPLQGSHTHKPGADTRYELNCLANNSGSIREAVYVDVKPAGPLASHAIITSSPKVITSGGSATATWDTRGKSCAVRTRLWTALPNVFQSVYPQNPVSGTGSWTTSFTAPSEFALYCSGVPNWSDAVVGISGHKILIKGQGSVPTNTPSLEFLDSDGAGYEHVVRYDGSTTNAEILPPGISSFKSGWLGWQLLFPDNGATHTVIVCRKEGTQISRCSDPASFIVTCNYNPGGACFLAG